MAWQVIIISQGYIFRGPPKVPHKTSKKNDISKVTFCPARSKAKNNFKDSLGWPCLELIPSEGKCASKRWLGRLSKSACWGGRRLPALQGNSVKCFCRFAWGFLSEKRRGFLVNFQGSSVFPSKQSTKSPQTIQVELGSFFGRQCHANG